jgi:hypothetical protein
VRAVVEDDVRGVTRALRSIVDDTRKSGGGQGLQLEIFDPANVNLSHLLPRILFIEPLLILLPIISHAIRGI